MLNNSVSPNDFSTSLIVGAVVVVAGIMVFFRMAFGIWVGMIAALPRAFIAFFWILSPYWPGALVIIALDLLVLYALSTPYLAYSADEYV